MQGEKEFKLHSLYFEYLAYNALPRAIERAAGEDAAFKLIIDAVSEGSNELFDELIKRGIEAGYVASNDLSLKESSIEHVIEYAVRLQDSIMRGGGTQSVKLEKSSQDEVVIVVDNPFPNVKVYKESLAAAVTLGMIRGILRRVTGLPVFVVRRKQMAQNPNLWRTLLGGKPGIVLYADKLPSEANGKLVIVARFIRP